MQSYDTNRQPTRSRSGFYNSLPAPTSASLIYAGIAAVLGLVLGLLIAWVVWPVQWTNAWPADLSQEARAQYLAAVAESYVYYGDAQAAEVARNRLFNLNDDLATAIAEAQAFFVDNPQASSRAYISNLGQLAQALNVQSPDIVIDTPIDGAPVAVVPILDSETGVGDSVRAWVNWALTVLAAIVLVGGGFYVVGRLNQRRLATSDADTLDDENNGFDDELGNIGYARPVSESSNPFARPIRGASSNVGMPTSVPVRETPQRQSEDYGFDDDDNEDELYTRDVGRTLDYRSEDESFEDPDDPSYDDELIGDRLDDDPIEQFHNTPQAISMPRRSQTTADDLVDEDEDFGEDDNALEGEPLGAEATVVATQPTTNRGVTPVRTLNTYSFQYHAGIPDYDQSRPIVDPETGLQVGDCGMGVNMKNNIVQNNPDNVVALDVWLVDKKQEKSFSSQDRVLLSEYVVDHNLEQTFTRERPNDPRPIIPQPGTTFQIKGPSLTLDCVVTDASYIKNGPAAGMFQSLSIDMTVRSHG